MVKNKALVLLLGLVAVSVVYAVTGKPRPQVGEKQDSAVTPNASTGPKPRNEKDEIYRGPPSNWDEGRVIVDVESSAASEDHKQNKSEVKK